MTFHNSVGEAAGRTAACDELESGFQQRSAPANINRCREGVWARGARTSDNVQEKVGC